MDPATKKTITRAVGAHMTFASLMGLFINVKMCFNFLKSEKTSFYILCTSKTVSNSLSLLGYLVFVAPTGYLYHQLGSDLFNKYMNQLMSFGLYLQGPIIQMMITVNRFLVVWFSSHSIPAASSRVTVAALSISWLFTAWFSALLGLPENCKTSLGYGHLKYFTLSPCAMKVTVFFVIALFSLAIFTNTMNALIAGKLWCAVKKQKGLSSETSKERLRRSKRFFLQSCLQDWISIVDILNNMAVSSISNNFWAPLITMGTDVMVYGIDGFIMYLFNYREMKKNTSRVFSKRNSGSSAAPTIVN